MEVIDKEPPTAVVGVVTVGQLVTTSWTRELTFRDLATPVASTAHPDLHRLSHYGSFSYFTPGSFTSLGRDTVGTPLRMAMTELRDQAELVHVGNATINGPNQGAARAVGTFFSMTAPTPATSVYPDLGSRDYLARRTADLSTRGMLASTNALAFRATITGHLHLMTAAFGSLLDLLSPLSPRLRLASLSSIASRLPLPENGAPTPSGASTISRSLTSLSSLASLPSMTGRPRAVLFPRPPRSGWTASFSSSMVREVPSEMLAAVSQAAVAGQAVE